MNWAQLHRRIVRGERGGWAGAAAVALAPLSVLYGCAVRLHGRALDRSPHCARSLPVASVCVGSLFAGGSGKTPFAAYLANLARAASWSPVLVAHGHQAQLRTTRVIAGGRGPGAPDWRRDGDETVLLARLAPRIPIVVARRRAESLAEAARAGIAANLVIFDGGFQDRRMRYDLRIVMLDASQPPDYARLLPLGEMREPWSALRRASLLILHRAELCRDRGEWQNHLDRVAAGLLVLWSSSRWSAPYELGGVRTIDWSALSAQRLGVWTSIGRPESFLAGLAERGIAPCWTESARDHAPFGEREVERIARVARKAALDALIVTEKDALKMESYRDRLPPVWCVVAEIEIEGGPAVLRAQLESLRTEGRRPW